MVHLKSIWESIWGTFRVCFGVHFGPSGVHFGVHFESMLRSDSDSLTLRVVAVDPDEPLPCCVVPCVFWSVLFSIGT